MNNQTTQVSFYHLTTSPFDKALFGIVGKVLENNMKAFILTNDPKVTSEIDAFLWSIGRISFVPHATISDPELEMHPILIGHEIPQNLKFDAIISVNDRSDFNPKNYSRVIDIFDGNLDTSIALARERWKKYKAEGLDLKYWCQDPKGNWQAKAA
ncbi:MAG: DNA polymerase III subunit chi [Alphaproteobacteria bacterium]|nr:DNA polymerase III subunit chi [Alphaproteobacteria bacterium]OJV15130.1 MAG: hypothetical protein BGO27_06810 [Alphaproteobacteria bacterium 33-17]